MKLYPMIFRPILKERIWGGTKLKTILDKDITSEITGESWELSTVENDISIVENGHFAGTPLNSVIENFPEQILGTQVHEEFGNQFPLLFKFIDAREDLSIQVHPNDELAQKRHNSFGKTEMWYIMQADPGSKLIVGFGEKSSAGEYVDHLNSGTLPEILDQVPVETGDCFFLATGTIHAIGAGILLAEIQQTSDITYRVYDWDRTDSEGKSRQLHVDEALDAMNYDVVKAKKQYSRNVNEANLMVDCPYFRTEFVPLDGKMRMTRDGRSFIVYMCVEGSFTIETGGENHAFKKGETILVPAAINKFSIAGKASLLQIQIS